LVPEARALLAVEAAGRTRRAWALAAAESIRLPWRVSLPARGAAVGECWSAAGPVAAVECSVPPVRAGAQEGRPA